MFCYNSLINWTLAIFSNGSQLFFNKIIACTVLFTGEEGIYILFVKTMGHARDVFLVIRR